MTPSTQIILDPEARHHRTGRVWQTHQRECLRQLAPVEVTVVDDAREAEAAARISAMKGFQKIIAVGGSEVARGVVNGLMGLADNHRKSLALGFLSLLHQDDWSRTMGLPRNVARQIEILKAGHTLPMDVGRVEFISPGGEAAARHFLNGAGFGLVQRIRHEWRGSGATEIFTGVGQALGELLRGRGSVVRIEGESGRLYEGPCPLGMVMCGRYYAALGRVAPQANPSDGALDVLWFAAESGWGTLARLAALLPFGTRAISPPGHSRSESFNVTAPGGAAVYLEADGALLGRLPACFSVEPGALRVIVPHVGVKVGKPKFAPLPKAKDGHLAGHTKGSLGRRSSLRRAG